MKLKPCSLALLIIATNLIINSIAIAQEVLDQAQYRFYYDYAWEFDTLTLNDTREDLIILQVGQNMSKSYSYATFYYDSLRASSDGERAMRQIRRELAISVVETGKPPTGFVRGAMGTRVYKNYPEGQMTITDRISSNHYVYKDDLNPHVWQITDSTKTILDYSVQMAVSDFRGRRWTAWFAPDIPISDGPWKFSGLPGLIMEAYDTEKHYRFIIVGIEQVEDEPIVFSPVVAGYRLYGNFEETTRLDFLRGLVRYRWNSSAIMNAELGKTTFDETSDSSRPHDLIERDYY